MMSMKLNYPAPLAIALLGLSLLGCDSPKTEPKPHAAVPKNEVILSADSPKRAYIKDAIVTLVQRPLMDPLSGQITYNESYTARVSSPISGRVIGSFAALGARVRAGETLAKLDSPDLGQAQSDYAGAVADLRLAERAFQRMEELYSHGIVPRKDFEQAQDSVTHARSESERARLKLANFGNRGGRTDNQFALLAPINGVITERNINPGMQVKPDLTNPLFVISDLSNLWLQMDVYEKDIDLIHVGAKVIVTVPAYPDEHFTATVTFINQVVDDTTRTVKVRCSLPNPKVRLLPAMYAAIDVQSDPGDQAVVIPLTALFTESESDWLYVDKGNGHYQKRPVKIGLRLKDKVVISEGLNPGENLVVDGALLLRAEESLTDDQTEKPEAGDAKS